MKWLLVLEVLSTPDLASIFSFSKKAQVITMIRLHGRKLIKMSGWILSIFLSFACLLYLTFLVEGLTLAHLKVCQTFFFSFKLCCILLSSQCLRGYRSALKRHAGVRWCSFVNQSRTSRLVIITDYCMHVSSLMGAQGKWQTVQKKVLSKKKRKKLKKKTRSMSLFSQGQICCF